MENILIQILKNANRPGFIIGEGIINRKDGASIIDKIRLIAKKYNGYNKDRVKIQRFFHRTTTILCRVHKQVQGTIKE